jgi:hypothetical protein
MEINFGGDFIDGAVNFVKVLWGKSVEWFCDEVKKS